MLQEFKKHIEQQFSYLKDKKLLIAISGGLDSVVLAHLCHELNLNISLAHCNFSLRGKESDQDEVFVSQLAQQLDCKIFVKTFSTETVAKEEKLSIQLAARQLRYNWFYDLLETHHFDYIFTAHHLDDNLETLLINLSRGTGLQGLLGIPKKNDAVIRPLLPFSRSQIEAFAKENNLEWREDSSNASTKYLRNKLRHEVIPLLKEINPNILENTKTTISHLKETADIVEESVDAVLKRAIKSMDTTKIVYNTEQFIKLNNPKAYVREVFKTFGFTAFSDIVNLLKAQSGKIVTSPTHQLLKDRDTLILTELKESTNFNIEINSKLNDVETPLGKLKFEKVIKVEEDRHSVFINADNLIFPLIVRSKIEGDYFYPLGMTGKKKLSKFFKDEKMSLLDKQKALILLSGNDVVWVINQRLDNRFKVTNFTKNILKVSII